MKLKPLTVILAALAIFVSGILITSAAGLWNTQSSKIPAKLDIPQYEGEYDPADIRGSYTFSEISGLFQIPLSDLAAAFGVGEQDAPAFKCKDLETIYGDSAYEIGTGSVRLFTAFYLGLPYDLTGDTFLTEAAAEILEERGSMTETQRDYLQTHTVPPV